MKMDNIKQAIRAVVKDTAELDSICSVLVDAVFTIRFPGQEQASEDTTEFYSRKTH